MNTSNKNIFVTKDKKVLLKIKQYGIIKIISL